MKRSFFRQTSFKDLVQSLYCLVCMVSSLLLLIPPPPPLPRPPYPPPPYPSSLLFLFIVITFLTLFFFVLSLNIPSLFSLFSISPSATISLSLFFSYFLLPSFFESPRDPVAAKGRRACVVTQEKRWGINVIFWQKLSINMNCLHLVIHTEPKGCWKSWLWWGLHGWQS